MIGGAIAVVLLAITPRVLRSVCRAKRRRHFHRAFVAPIEEFVRQPNTAK